MKLTRRQETFILKLLDLYRELHCPIHYSVLAERVGVTRSTAYDMLRLLEEKGLVASEYRLDRDKPTPGRSEIVFWPTERARQFMAELTQEVAGDDWKTIKDLVLDKVRTRDIRERELAKEMLANVPSHGPAALRYCIEVMTVMSLRLRHGAGRKLLANYLPQILQSKEVSNRANLSFLGGFALGVLIDENSADREWNHELLEHVMRYQRIVSNMDDNLCRLLGKGLKDVYKPLIEIS